MKILFFSDIHGIDKNIDFLRKLNEEENFDKIIILGDLFEGGLFYNRDFYNPLNIEIFLSEIKDKLLVIRGNRDFDIPKSILIKEGPISFYIEGKNVYLAHGHEYYEDFDFKDSILIHGHEHIPYINKYDNYIEICVGSISLPRGNSSYSYLIYKNNCFMLFDFKRNILDSIEI